MSVPCAGRAGRGQIDRAELAKPKFRAAGGMRRQGHCAILQASGEPRVDPSRGNVVAAALPLPPPCPGDAGTWPVTQAVRLPAPP